MAEKRAFSQDWVKIDDAGASTKIVSIDLSSINGIAFDNAMYTIDVIWLAFPATHREVVRRWASYKRVSGTLTEVAENTKEPSGAVVDITFAANVNNVDVTVTAGQTGIHGHVFWRVWASQYT